MKKSSGKRPVRQQVTYGPTGSPHVAYATTEHSGLSAIGAKLISTFRKGSK